MSGVRGNRLPEHKTLHRQKERLRDCSDLLGVVTSASAVELEHENEDGRCRVTEAVVAPSLRG